MARKRLIVPIFIPHQGCPYRCVFCNQTDITGQDKQADHDMVLEPLREYLGSRPLDQMPEFREAAFYGGTFTGLPSRRQEFLLSLLQPWLDDGMIHAIRVSTHSLYIDAGRLALLKKYRVKTVELGVQSTDPEVLNLSGRETAPGLVAEAAALIRKNNFNLGLQLMPGLPGDTVEKFMRSVDEVLSMKPDFVRLYPTLVIRNTRLHEMYRRGEYRPWDMETTIDALKLAALKFAEAGVPVIRIGLHPEPSLLKGYVAGPFHPSMRYLVDCRIGLDRMVKILKGQNTLPDQVAFRVPSNEFSIYTGHKKENLGKLKKLFGLDKVSLLRGKKEDELELVA